MCAASRLTSDRWSIAAVAVAAIAPYLNALQAGFAFDDGPVIRHNPLVTGSFDFWGILAAPLYPGNLYRPLTLLSYAVNEYLMPGSAMAFHALNVALHAGVSVLVFLVGVRWCRSRAVALAAALLFAVHPIHTEAVTSVVGRAEILAALFGLIALYAGVRSADSRRAGWDALAVLSFGAALSSKESALTLLPLIVLLRAAHRGGSLWPALARELRSGHWIPFALVAGLFLLTRSFVVGALTIPARPTPLDNVLAHAPADVRVRSACAVLADYVGLLLMPLVLSADYSWRQVVPEASWASLGVVCGMGILAVGLLTVFGQARRRPPVSVLAAFPLITLSLTSNLLFAIGTVKAERLLYLPSAGFFLLVSLLLFGKETYRHRRWPSAFLVLMLVAFAARTWLRNPDWLDSLSLYRATVQAAPRSAKAHHNLAVALEQRGETEAAQIHYREALRLYDGYEESAFGLALIYEKKGLADGAIHWYRKTLEITPSHDGANTNLCRLLYRERHYALAESACRHALRFDPTDANLLKGLGASLLAEGDRERGIGALQRSLAINPDDGELRALLARLETGDTTPSG